MARDSPSGRRTPVTLAVVWWFALGGLGLFFPYYSLYLSENAGLRGGEIGLVMATLPLVGVLAQPFWGQVADRSGRRGRILALLAAGTGIGYAGIALADGILGFALCTASLALFSTSLIPMCVSVSLAALPDPTGTLFGRVRVMGTLGFAMSIGLFPWLLRLLYPDFDTATSAPSMPGLWLIFPLAAGMLCVASLASLRVPEQGNVSARADRGEWRLLLRNGPYLRVLALAFLTYLFTQGAMVLFPILVRAQGGGIEAISQMWLIMLSLEIPLVFFLGAAVHRFGPRGVIAIGLAASALRWGVSGFVTDLRLVYLAQALHGVTVFGLILGVPVLIDRIVPDRLRATAQGGLAMIGISLGSILSNLTAGWLIDAVGPMAPARVAGAASLLLLFLMPKLLPPIDYAEPHGDR
jgi:PPP family 3-phenylpropionic acid transporter